MKVIDLQTIMDGNAKLVIEKHDGYCLSVVEKIDVKDLEKSKYKDDEIDLLSAGKYEIWIRL